MTKLVIALMLSPAIALINAFTFGKLWQWFIYDLTGVETPSLAALYGLSLTISYLTSRYTKDERPFIDQAIYPFSLSGVTLLFGYVAHLFV